MSSGVPVERLTVYTGWAPRATRRHLLRGAAGIGLGLVLDALGSPAGWRFQPGVAGAAVVGQPLSGHIEFWSRETQDSGARQPLINAHLAAFDRLHGTTSRAQFMVFQESIQKTLAAIAAGSPPDLGQQGPDVTMQFASAGHLLAIDEVAAELEPQLAPLQRDAFVTVGGRAYSVPWYLETRVLFYHRDLLERAGVRPPTTWREWVEAAQATTTPDQFGFVVPVEGTFPGQLWIPLGIANGGLVLDEAGNVVVNSPPMKEALAFLTDFLLVHKTMDEAGLTYKNSDLLQLFLLKRIAMIVFNGELIRAVLDQAPQLLDTLEAVTLPVNRPEQMTRSFLGGWQLFVFANGKNPRGGVELLKWLFEPTFYADYTMRTGGAALPVTRAVLDQPFYAKDALRSVLVKQMATAVRYGGPLYGTTPYMGEAEGKLLFSQPVTDVLNGKRTVDEAVTWLERELKQLAGQ